MCPMCFATVAWIAAGVTSMGGGVYVLAAARLRARAQEPTTNNENREQGERDGQES